MGGVVGEDVYAVGDDEMGCFDGELLGSLDGLTVGELHVGRAVGSVGESNVIVL